MSEWPGSISAITLFCDDLTQAREFYERVFGLPVHYEDDDSAVFAFGSVLVNLLDRSQVPELIAPAALADASAGHRMQLTLTVEDVDATCADLAARGVELLNGPIDRPWGIRTASFVDPSGNIWEIAR